VDKTNKKKINKEKIKIKYKKIKRKIINNLMLKTIKLKRRILRKIKEKIKFDCLCKYSLSLLQLFIKYINIIILNGQLC
jgi:hypothetical protein